jgi:uncharacterized protein (TIGR04141 family)
LKVLIGSNVSASTASTMTAPIDLGKFEVVFAIVTHKPKAKKSGNLPLFSRMSLMRNLKELQLMSVEGSFGFVQDAKPKSAGMKKPSKKRT